MNDWFDFSDIADTTDLSGLDGLSDFDLSGYDLSGISVDDIFSNFDYNDIEDVLFADGNDLSQWGSSAWNIDDWGFLSGNDFANFTVGNGTSQIPNYNKKQAVAKALNQKKSAYQKTNKKTTWDYITQGSAVLTQLVTNLNRLGVGTPVGYDDVLNVVNQGRQSGQLSLNDANQALARAKQAGLVEKNNAGAFGSGIDPLSKQNLPWVIIIVILIALIIWWGNKGSNGKRRRRY